MKNGRCIIRRILLLLTLTLLWISASPSTLLAQQAPADPLKALQDKAQKVYIIRLVGEVDDIMAKSLERRLSIANKGGATLIVYDIDGPGGRELSCLAMTQMTRTQPIPTVAWIHNRAYSADAILALSCSHIIVSADSSMGDCAPISINPVDGWVPIPATERAKANSPILQDIAASAKKNGFDPNLGYAMVEVERTVSELHNNETNETRVVADEAQKKELLDFQIVRPDNTRTNPWRFVREIDGPKTLLVLDASDALKSNIALAQASNIDELRSVLGIRDEPIMLDYTYAELFAWWLDSWWVRGLLFTLMLVFAWVEFSHPGTLFGGIGALICLVLIVAAPYMAGIAQAWEIAVIVLGVAIVIIDLVFAGGIGLAAVPGFILIAVGIVATFVPAEPGGGWIPHRAQTYTFIEQGLSAVVFGTIAAIGAFFFMAKYLYITPGFRRLQLRPALAGVSVPVQDASDTPAADAVFPGAIGTAATDLRPAGKARFGPHLVDVVTEGQFVESGDLVTVLHASASRVVVKPQAQSYRDPDEK